jgi:hypothetical protein
MAMIRIPQSDAHVTQTALTKAGEAPHHTELEGEFGMVDFVVTPPYVIPIAIALAVLAVATFKAPEKTPDFYRVTIDLPKATYDALARKATVDTPVRAVASRIVVDSIIP